MSLLRAKRFVYNANATCGHLPFCSSEIHALDLTLNTSLADDPRCSASAAVFTVALEIVLSLLILFSNGLILYVMNVSTEFCDAQSVLKTSLAASDFLVGAIILPTAVCNKIRIMFWPLPDSYLRIMNATEDSPKSVIMGALFSICISASLFSLMLLVIDRFLAVHSPFRYCQGELMTRNKAVGLSVATWCLAIVLGLLPLGDSTRFSYDVDYLTMNVMLEIKANPVHNPHTIAHGFFFLVLVFIFPYVCIVAVTVTTWCKFWRMKPGLLPNFSLCTASTGMKEQSVGECGANHRKSVNLLSKQDFDQLTRVIFIMVTVFSICVVPFFVVQAENLAVYPGELEYIQTYGDRGSHKCNPVLHLVVVELLYLNSFSNFVIYNLRNEQFRIEVRKLLRLDSKLSMRCSETKISSC